MKKDALKIIGKFQAIKRLSDQLDQAPRKFGTNELISHSEIHLIEIIGDNEGLSVTDIAQYMGITKGAVSQSLKRLENKGLTDKKPDPLNLSRSIVMLTSKGFAAYYTHKHWHETMDGGFAGYMDDLGEKDLHVIIDFLNRFESFLERRAHSIE